ncbi:(+)-gamma-cadinene synthase [Dorcoceras hygrometricum]|uniref:(+)-gamma-cadinene synthase n=1 Tax=Dorcoceras hygrometricum TaxID=472368 RepID=A0A2Z7C1Y8_9LAMI|nr:(+)-gamma-cadinene synthase [Dorcoceras hygrometricum]
MEEVLHCDQAKKDLVDDAHRPHGSNRRYFMLWAKTTKFSELIMRMEMIDSKMFEQFMQQEVAEHCKNFNKDKSSTNRDMMSIRLLEA